MDDNARPDDPSIGKADTASSGFTRRAVLAGIGGSAVAGTAADANESSRIDLDLSYETPRKDAVLITLTRIVRSDEPSTLSTSTIAVLRWAAGQFGSDGPFKITRDSVVESNSDEKTGNWRPVKWTLEVPGASFPGGKIGKGGLHDLTFEFERKSLTAWGLKLKTQEWPKKGQTRWGGSGRADEIDVEAFLNGSARLATDLVSAEAQAVLSDWFGERIEVGDRETTRLDLGMDLNWNLRNVACKPEMHILLFPVSFSELRVERIHGDPDTPPLGGGSRKDKPIGLLGTAGGIVTLPPEGEKERRFELGRIEDGPSRLTATIVLYDIGHEPYGKNQPVSSPPGQARLTATLRQTGEPAHTVAAMSQGGATPTKGTDGKKDGTPLDPGPGSSAPQPAPAPALSAIGHVEFATDDKNRPVEIFDFTAIQIERWLESGDQHREHVAGNVAGKHVLTRTLLTPSDKEHVVRTDFGPIEIRGLLPVTARPGAAPRVPPILIETHDTIPNQRDRRGKILRRLTEFEARLGLVSAAVRLPARIADSRKVPPGPDEHTTRLEFDLAECRFTMPIVRQHEPAAVDADIPIGPLRRDEKRHALFDLSRARLTVLRPSDLLSLKFRFSGLQLELPLPKKDQEPARVVPSRGGLLCRAGGPAMGEAKRRGKDVGSLAAEISARDERPLLVVEFPPQHVMERAYFGQRTPPDLPDPKLDTVFSAEDQRPKLPGFQSVDVPALVARFDSLPKDEDRQNLKNALANLRAPKLPRRHGPEKDHTNHLERTESRRTISRFLDEAGWNTKFREEMAKPEHLPPEQRIYVSPEFLDEAARHTASEIAKKLGIGQKPSGLGCPPDVDISGPPDNMPPGFDATSDLKRSDLFESAKEIKNGDYREFRRLFARKVRLIQPTPTASNIKGSNEEIEAHAQYRGGDWFKKIKPRLKELGSGKFPAVDEPIHPSPGEELIRWVETYKPEDSQNEEIDPVTPSRLSGPSRLAFRINCDDFQSERTGGGFDFSLEALTNWGSMDLAVVRRAERLFLAPERGAPPPRWGRIVDEDPAANLAFQGISVGDRLAIEQDRQLRGEEPKLPDRKAGRISPAQRLAEVAANAGKSPDLFETAIELPARLFLSPAQDATWLTPNDSIRHRLFPSAVAETCRELWSATLGGSKQSAGLRAVWSPDFRPDALLSRGMPGASPWGPYAPWALPRSLGVRSSESDFEGIPRFRTSLDAFDRHELVVLSSVHGLPVLGRRRLDGEIAVGGSQIDPPDGYRLSGLALDKPPIWDNVEQKVRDLSAIYVPQALSVSELALTSLGGNLNLDTTFTPPSSARLRGSHDSLFDALNIERWRHRTVLGRDILVEVVYKGFLFPIGHKATLVKITERRFESRHIGGRPIAVLIQRMFLRIGEPVKLFPAYDHPNGGRRWPCDRVTMLTRQTPDLVEPIDEQGGRIRFEGSPGRIFWPRTARRDGAEVKFQMLMNDEAAPCAMPLVFVDNQAANDQETMQRLVDWYNGPALGDDGKLTSPPAGASSFPARSMRDLPRGGQPVRMAAERKPGDTTFETQWWELKAEGRQSRETNPPPGPVTNAAAYADARISNRNYVLDPFMNGLDQPPFYPVCEAARCRFTTIERFTGGTEAWAVAAYDGYYVVNSFDDEKQQKTQSGGTTQTGNQPQEPKDEPPAPGGEIFLRLVNHPEAPAAALKMRMQSGDRSGGIGQPNLDVVGISRATGPVGAADKAGDVPLEGPVSTDGNGVTRLPSVVRFSAPPKGASQQSEGATTGGEAGSAATAVNPTDLPEKAKSTDLLEKAKRMFPGDAKLLGLVPLSQVIMIATGKASEIPRLREIVEYGAAGAREMGAETRELLTENVLIPIRKALDEVEKQWAGIAKQNLKLGSAASYSLDAAYPQLGKGLSALKRAIDDAVRAASDADFFAGLATIYEAGRALVGAIGRILRDPLASASEAQIGQIRDIIAKIKAGEDPARILIASIIAEVIKKPSLDWLTDQDEWLSTLFVFPLYDDPFKNEADRLAFRKALAVAAKGAMRQTIEDVFKGDLKNAENNIRHFANDFLENLSAEANNQPQSLKKIIETAVEQIRRVAPGNPSDPSGMFWELLASPYLKSLARKAQKVATDIEKMKSSIAASPSPETVLGLLTPIQDMADTFLGDSRISDAIGKATADACKKLTEALLPAFGEFAAALLPPALVDIKKCREIASGFGNLADAKPKTPPKDIAVGADDISKLCVAVFKTGLTAYKVETALPEGAAKSELETARIQFAAGGRNLSWAMARLGIEIGRVSQWRGQKGWTCPSAQGLTFSEPTAFLQAYSDLQTSVEKNCRDFVKLIERLSGAATQQAEQELKEAVTALVTQGEAILTHLGSTTLLATLPAGARKTAREEFEKGLKTIATALGNEKLFAELIAAVGSSETWERLDAKAKAARAAIAAIPRNPADLNQVKVALSALKDASASTLDDCVKAITKEILATVEQQVAGALTRLALASITTASQIDKDAAATIRPILQVLATGYGRFKTERDKVYELLKNPGSNQSPLLRSILAVVGGGRLESFLLVCEASNPSCGKDDDRLAGETIALDAAEKATEGSPPSLVGALAALREPLSRPASDLAPVEILRRITKIDGEFVRTIILSAIDLKAIRRDIESRIRNLIPARVTLPYRLDNELASFPSKNSIFVPAAGTRLKLETNAIVHLLPDEDGLKAPEFNVSGEMGPFAINLVGQAFDVVTVNFHGLTFKAGSGRSADLSVKFKSVKIGEKAKFLEPLQEYLSPKGGGFFLKALEDRPGLEAGYGINLGVIGCGVLSFSNVTLNAAARLPFDPKGSATFLISIGRSDAPFLISSTIFGGGGYLALIADSGGIVGFEATFDYGGVAAFGFGPLQGVGRLTIGIYLRKERERTTIGGTFFAGGSAHICGFGLCASLLVRMKQDSPGPMQGEATFTFSFSIGIDDIEFEVKVQRNQGQQMGQQASLGPRDGPLLDFVRTRYASSGTRTSDAEPSYVLAAAPGGKAKPGTSASPAVDEAWEPRLTVSGVTMASDWSAYRGYFDDNLKPASKRPRPSHPPKPKGAPTPRRGATP